MQKLQTIAAAALGLVAMSHAVAAQDSIRVATEGAYPPFNYVEADGTVAGFDVDITEALCEAAGLTCEMVVQAWDGLIPGLLAERYDMIVAAMLITPERAEVVAFSDRYATLPQRFVMSEALADEVDAAPGEGIEQLEAVLEGRVIGLVAATASDSYVRDLMGDRATFRSYQQMADAVQDLISGRIDAYADAAIGIADTFLDTPAGEGFRFGGVALTDPDYFGEGTGIAFRQDDDELRERINAALAQILADGTYAEINDRHFSFNVYGE